MSDFNNNILLSKYAQGLQGTERHRYELKIAEFNLDPYLMEFNENLLPTNISFIEIYEYLVQKKSFYTSNELKAYKSLGSYKLYESGWVQYLGGKKHKNALIVFGKVLHSQALNLPPLKVWIHHEESGFINSGHCTCVAGLGECCSHIGAVLFALNAVYQHILASQTEVKSVTDVKAYWMVPSCKTALQLCNEDISYTSKQKVQPAKQNIQSNVVTRPEMVNFVGQLAAKGKTPVLMMGLRAFIPPDFEIEHLLDVYFSNLFSLKNENKSVESLIDNFKLEDFKMSEEKVQLIQKVTKTQGENEYWHKLRLGRITASIFKRVCRTRLEKGFPMGLLKKICYPTDFINTAAINYGRTLEKEALKHLFKQQKCSHNNLQLLPTGLIIWKEKTFYAASPDAIWSCSCCGIMPVEIICPYSFKDGDLTKYLIRKNCPIFSTDDGSYSMIEKHDYYYQVQLQGYIVRSCFAYFYIYSRKTTVLVKVAVNNAFVEGQMRNTDNIFVKYIFPELLGKYYSNKPN